MNKSRVLVLGIAFLAAGGAAMLAKNFVGGTKTERVVETRFMNTTQVLVAAQPIKLGQMVSPAQLTWQAWPKDAITSSLIEQSGTPGGTKAFDKAISRTSYEVGEPINKHKLIKRNQGGVMAAILTPGMRAISAKIKEATSAGGFILPNDRVDVILSRKLRSSNETKFVSSTILENVRVLAIGQNIEQPQGQQTSIGKTATLELSIGQAETLALAENMGEISLALRSMSESFPEASKSKGPKLQKSENAGVIRVMKFGQRIQGFGVQ